MGRAEAAGRVRIPGQVGGGQGAPSRFQGPTGGPLRTMKPFGFTSWVLTTWSQAADPNGSGGQAIARRSLAGSADHKDDRECQWQANAESSGNRHGECRKQIYPWAQS